MNYSKLHSGVMVPETTAKAMVFDTFLYGRGGFKTADPQNKNTAAWSVSSGSADSDTLPDLPTIRKQSRDLCRNDPLAVGAVNGVVTSVVGTGIVPQSNVDAEFLGLTQEAAEEWQRKAERLFAHVADRTWFDAERRQTFWQQQQTVYRSRLESGDVFAIRRIIPRPGKMLGLSVQIIEADRVQTPADKIGSSNIRGGIELDNDGAPFQYWILQQHPGERMGGFASTDFTQWPAFDGAGNPVVLPIMNITRPSQTRGVPYLAPVIETLKQLSRYSEAEITAAVISSLFAVFVKSPSPTAGPLTAAPMSIPGAIGPAKPPAGNGPLQKMQSGMIIDLAPGEEIQVADAVRPNTAFDPFVQAVLRQIGTALELPFEVLIKHFTASYSAARAALLEAWKFYRKERAHLVATYCQPVWEWVIYEAVARGQLEAPGFFDDPLKREAYLRCDWVGEEQGQIDPLKEANAAAEWNKLGVWSLSKISAQQGLDYAQTHKQLVKEKAMREADGLPLNIDQKLQPPNNGQGSNQ